MQPLTANPSDILLTVAEIAVAFAGFASIVAIFQARWTQDDAPFDLFRFWVMLAFSLAALLFALIPFPLHFLGVAPSEVWRASSLLLACFVVANTLFVGRLYWRGVAAVVTSLNPVIAVFAYAIYAVILIAQIANAAGLLGGPGFGLYLLGLLLILFSAALNFVRLVWVGRDRLGPPPACDECDSVEPSTRESG